MRQILPVKIQETVPNPRPAASCVYKLTCFKLEGRRALGTQDDTGCVEAGILKHEVIDGVGMTVDSAVMRSSSDEIKTNMSHI